MQAYIIKRLLQAAITILGITVVVFMLTRLTGDPRVLFLPPEAKQEDYERLGKLMGLDRPLVVQYWSYISRAMRGDFGQSLKYPTTARALIQDRLPNTLKLAGVAIGIAVVLGIPIGVLSALRPGGWVDSFGGVFAVLGQSMPSFWVGLMLIFLLSVRLGWLPTSGITSWKHLIMPGFTLGWYSVAALTRLTRSAMLDVLDSEYVKMVRIKGAPERAVIWKHAFRNASIPILTLASLQILSLINGSLVVEQVFAVPGMGRLALDGVLTRDYPVVQTVVLWASTLFVLVNLLVDVLYAYIDPRIRYV